MVTFSRQDLLDSGARKFAPKPSLPAPPFLMFDRIVDMDKTSGIHGKGIVIAELDVVPDLWFFDCHFKEDPVMPGCLQVDALWQMLGFFQAHHGAQGHGRALGAGAIKFTGQITPARKLATYTLHIKRYRIGEKLSRAFADGVVNCDGRVVCTTSDLDVGIFHDVSTF